MVAWTGTEKVPKRNKKKLERNGTENVEKNGTEAITEVDGSVVAVGALGELEKEYPSCTTKESAKPDHAIKCRVAH